MSLGRIPGSVLYTTRAQDPARSPPPPTSISFTTFTWSSFFRMAISWYTRSRGSSCLAGPPWAAWDPLGGGRPVARKRRQARCRSLGPPVTPQPASSKTLQDRGLVANPPSTCPPPGFCSCCAPSTPSPTKNELGTEVSFSCLPPAPRTSPPHAPARGTQAQGPIDTYVESHTASVTSFWKGLSLPKEGGAGMSLVCSHQGAVQAGHMCTESRRVHWAPAMPLREWLGVAKLGEEVATSESRPYPSGPKRLSGALPSKVSASDCILPGSRRSLPLHTPRDREFTPFSDRVALCLPSIASAHTPPSKFLGPGGQHLPPIPALT